MENYDIDFASEVAQGQLVAKKPFWEVELEVKIIRASLSIDSGIRLNEIYP